MDHLPALGAQPIPRLSRRGVVLAGVSAGTGLLAAGVLPMGLAASRRRRAPRRAAMVHATAAPVEPPPSPVVPAAPAAPVLAPTPVPPVVRRGTWAEREPAPNHDPMPRIARMTIHHTGADTRSLGATDFQTVQRIEHYHRDQLGWACIGYHFLIGADGRIYEGRPLALQGAHVRDANRGNLGVALIGDCQAQAPSPQQLASLQFLLEAARQRYHLGPADLFGHRDLAPTTCPGDQLYGWIQDYRNEVGATGRSVLARSGERVVGAES